jgi:alanyl-tRNA synthetase
MLLCINWYLSLADQMGDAFPELRNQQALIERVIQEEEESFLRTLAKGIERLEARMTNSNRPKVCPEMLYSNCTTRLDFHWT